MKQQLELFTPEEVDPPGWDRIEASDGHNDRLAYAFVRKPKSEEQRQKDINQWRKDKPAEAEKLDNVIAEFRRKIDLLASKSRNKSTPI